MTVDRALKSVRFRRRTFSDHFPSRETSLGNEWDLLHAEFENLGTLASQLGSALLAVPNLTTKREPDFGAGDPALGCLPVVDSVRAARRSTFRTGLKNEVDFNNQPSHSIWYG